MSEHDYVCDPSMKAAREVRVPALADQPPPTKGGMGPAAWDAVRQRFQELVDGERLACPKAVAVALDGHMVDRDRLGEDRYGVRLRPNNGRDNLVDAQQEALDLCAYLANEALATTDEDVAAELDGLLRVTLRSLVRLEVLRANR